MQKNAYTSGADENTQSRAQFFSWVNNTNEGSTEAQTLINLNYFKWLRDEYGMHLDIYALDAGNLDGSGGTYETPDGPKLRVQYPNGYAPIAKAAAELCARLGVWCGPDGFGDTDKEAAARRNLMVSLCRDYGFALFKIDGVCGQLRPEKREEFVRMMKECREYRPDLILLNHRLELGIGMPYATTFLWEGVETYVDVHVCNPCTAPHNRAHIFFRNRVPGNVRLAEDHGVCISSCPDYFDDELIYQAFNRCLILAPEIYGNPWFLRDDEQTKLARIYNLHRRYAPALVNSVDLPEEYTPYSTARGDGITQFVTLGNSTWNTKKVLLALDETIGLKKCGRIAVTLRHPYERLVGIFDYGGTAEIGVMPFRAALVEVTDASVCGDVLAGCDYEVLHETDGVVDRVKLVRSSGSVVLLDPDTGVIKKNYDIPAFDIKPRVPSRIASMMPSPIPANAEALLEATLFAADNNSLEARAVKRSGETAIPQVKSARDAFFGQKRYRLRGCDSAFAFDGKDDTFFDGLSKTEFGGCRVDGGCLRADFGAICDADTLEIEYFSPSEPTREFAAQEITVAGTYSADLDTWHAAPLIDDMSLNRDSVIETVISGLHTIGKVRGQKKRLRYAVGGSIRYFRLPRPVDRVFKISLIHDGAEVRLPSPRVNNLFCPNGLHDIAKTLSATVRVSAEEWREGCYIAIALEGVHGVEGAYAAAATAGVLHGFPTRAPSYPSNYWECIPRRTDRFYTYYLPLTEDMTERDIKLYVLSVDGEHTGYTADVYLCDANAADASKTVIMNI